MKEEIVRLVWVKGEHRGSRGQWGGDGHEGGSAVDCPPMGESLSNDNGLAVDVLTVGKKDPLVTEGDLCPGDPFIRTEPEAIVIILKHDIGRSLKVVQVIKGIPKCGLRGGRGKEGEERR